MYRTIGIIVLVVLAGLAGAAALIVYNRGALTPEEVTRNFYREWIRTKGNENPIEKGLHRESTYVSRLLGNAIVAQAERASTTDPVLCSTQGVPTGFQVIPSNAPVTSTSTRARTSVNVQYPSGAEQVGVLLVKEGSWWRIDEIECY